MKAFIFLLSVLLVLPLQSCASEEKSSDVVDVYIIAGQSNAVGFNHYKDYDLKGVKFPEEIKTQPGVMTWLNGQFSPALSVSELGGFGPELNLIYSLNKGSPKQKNAVIKYAIGGTGIARSIDYDDFVPALKNYEDHGRNGHPADPDKEAGDLYQNMVSSIKSATDELTKKNIQWKLAGFVWMQGEHEASINKDMTNDYEKLLSHFITSVRKDLQAPKLHFLIGGLSSYDYQFGDILRTAQKNVALNDPHTTLINTADLGRNGSGGFTHYDVYGMLEFGKMCASALAK
jgi:hypothetical protein